MTKVYYGGAHTPTNVRIKEHHNIVEVSIYDRMMWKRIDGMEEEILQERAKRGSVSDEIQERSLQRSFAILRDYSLSNYHHFHSFITLTFEENISDLSVAHGHFEQWVKKIRRVYPDFMYLGVPEFQKRGAVHYHVMTNIPCGSDLLPQRERIWTYNKAKDKYYPLDYYDIPYWTDKNGKLGNSSAFDLQLTDDKFSVTAYLTKYFFKEKDNRLFNKVKVLHSNNLKKPNVIRCLETDKEFQNYLEYLQKNLTKVSEKTLVSYDPKKPTVKLMEYKK